MSWLNCSIFLLFASSVMFTSSSIIINHNKHNNTSKVYKWKQDIDIELYIWHSIFARYRLKRLCRTWDTMDISQQTQSRTSLCLIVSAKVFAIFNISLACLRLENWIWKLLKLWRDPGMFATLSDKTICLRETCFYFMQCLKTLSLSNNNNSILDISLLPASAGSGIKAINIIGHKEEGEWREYC